MTAHQTMAPAPRRKSWSLRARVALASALAAGVVVLLITAASAATLIRNESDQLDRRADAVAEAVASAGALTGSGRNLAAKSYSGRGYIATVRQGDSVIGSRGPILAQTSVGLSDQDVGSQTYRVRTIDLAQPSGAVLSVGIPEDVTSPLAGTRFVRLVLGGIAAVVLAAVLGWLFAGRAVRPLRQLTEQTRHLGSYDSAAAPRVTGAAEAEELADAMTDMLGRVRSSQSRTDRALEVARDFSAAAAHELRTPLTAMRTDLDVLRNHNLSASDSAEVIADLTRTQRRIEDTVTALGQLAAGELARAEDRRPFDVVEVLDRVARDSQRTHRDTNIAVDAVDAIWVRGWSDGIRLAADNLVRNAVQHGRASHVVLGASRMPNPYGPDLPPIVRLTVDDDGQGLPAEERTAVLGRFRRGSTAAPGGSGLGLALVVQQAVLHDGRVELLPSPMGGLRVTIELPGL